MHPDCILKIIVTKQLYCTCKYGTFPYGRYTGITKLFQQYFKQNRLKEIMMPTTFKWTGKTPKGTVQQGELSAETKEDVIAALRKQGLIPTIIAEKKAPAKIEWLSKGKKIKDRDIIVFTRSLPACITPASQ